VGRTVEAVVHIDGNVDEIFARLTDYPKLKNWLPGVNDARVLVREGDVVVVEVAAPGLGAPSLVLELVHAPPAKAHFTRVDRYRGEGTTGLWALAESDTGSGADLRVRLQPGAGLVGLGGRRRFREGLDKALEAIRAGFVEKKPEPEPESEDRRKILEVTRSGDTVVVWHRGEVFELPRRSAEDC
jgi:hypothetical protein